MYFFGCLLGKCMCAWGFGKSPLFKHVFFLSPVSSMILDLGKIHAFTDGFCKKPQVLNWSAVRTKLQLPWQVCHSFIPILTD